MSKNRYEFPIRKLVYVFSILLLILCQGTSASFTRIEAFDHYPYQNPTMKSDIAAPESELRPVSAGKDKSGLAETTRAAEYEISWLVKLDAQGREQWTQRHTVSRDNDYYGPHAIIPTAGGGFALVGGLDEGKCDEGSWLLKANAQGRQEWTRCYGRDGAAVDIVQTTDDGFVMLGSDIHYDGDDQWIRKIDSKGNEQWERSIQDRDFQYRYITQILDGGFVILGYHRSELENDPCESEYFPWVLKIDAAGKKKWERTYDLDGWPRKLVPTADGGMAFLIGRHLIKTDRYGAMYWKQTYDRDFQDLILTTDGGFVLIGYHEWDGVSNNSYLVKTDKLGVIEWIQDYDGVFYSGIQTMDGGFALLGSTDTSRWRKDGGRLLKTNITGEMEWIARTWAGRFTTVMPAVDGGFVLAGTPTGDSNEWMVLYANGASFPENIAPPIFTSLASDIELAEGMTDELTWTAETRYPDLYIIYLNSERIAVRTLSDGSITWKVEQLVLGIYNVTLVVQDAALNRISDTVWITVTKSPKSMLEGYLLWNQTYGGWQYDQAESIIQTADGGYALAGTTDGDTLLVKTDILGKMEWYHTYGGPNEDIVRSVIQTADSGFVLIGTYGAGREDGWLVKTDAHGELEWARTYGSPPPNGVTFSGDPVYSGIQTADGGFALCGRQIRGGWQPWLVKTDSNGEMEWQQIYKTYPTPSRANAVIQTADGGYALCGFNGFNLIKTDAHGEMEWLRSYASSKRVLYTKVIQTIDAGYILVGTTEQISYRAPNPQSILVKIDTTGKVEWNKTYDGQLNSIIQTPDGRYILAGHIKVDDDDIDAQLLKLDSEGNELWRWTYGGGGWDEARAVIQTGDGAFAFAGRTSSFGADKYDFWLVKTVPPPPTIMMLNPQNTTYSTPLIPIAATSQFLIDKAWWRYWKGTWFKNQTLTWDASNDRWGWEGLVLPDGSYQVQIFMNNSVGMESSVTQRFTVDTTPPTLSVPPDITYPEGTSNNLISWTVEDLTPTTYEIYQNSSVVDSGPWMSGKINRNVDGYAVGRYNFTLIVQDIVNHTAVDTVWVIVTPLVTTLPELGIGMIPGLFLLAVNIIGLRRKRKERLGDVKKHD